MLKMLTSSLSIVFTNIIISYQKKLLKELKRTAYEQKNGLGERGGKELLFLLQNILFGCLKSV